MNVNNHLSNGDIINPKENITTQTKNRLPSSTQNGYIFLAVLNQIAERGNSNYLSTANSTPKACFFIRIFRTPKKINQSQNGLVAFFPMVANSGKGIALCYVPLIVVFHPVIRYRQIQIVENLLAVTSRYLINGAIAEMLYKFQTLGEKRLNIFIRANSQEQARQRLTFTCPIVCVARYRNGGIYA